jgi:hypothetical protein
VLQIRQRIVCMVGALYLLAALAISVYVPWHDPEWIRAGGTWFRDSGYNWIWRLDGGTLDAATLIVEHIALMFGAALLALVVYCIEQLSFRFAFFRWGTDTSGYWLKFGCCVAVIAAYAYVEIHFSFSESAWVHFAKGTLMTLAPIALIYMLVLATADDSKAKT